MAAVPDPTPRAARLLLVPPQRGAAWVRQGFTIFAKKPLAFSALLATFLFGALLLVVVPVIGPLVLIAALPLVSLGFMIAGHVALHGHVPTPIVFVAPLRRDRARVRSMAILGAIYAAGTLLVLLVSSAIDGGRVGDFQDLLGSGNAEPAAVAELLADPRLQWGLIARFGLTALLSVPFWHAPALVHWSGQTALKALFFSTVACWRNKGAFTVYALTWGALLIGFVMFSSLVFGLLGLPQLVTLLALPVVMLFTTAFYASLFFTFAECFEIAPAAVAPTP